MRPHWWHFVAVGMALAAFLHHTEGYFQEKPRFINQTDKQILDFLIDPSRYDRRMRPLGRTVVNVSVLLLTLSSPDESSLRYEVEFLMHQVWEDHRLVYDDGGRHPYLNAMMHTEQLWMPDTYFIKHGEFKTPLAPVHIALKLFKNGTVLYTMRRHMVLTCEGNLRIFPFDSPKCFFGIESVSHEETQVKLQWSGMEPPISKAGSIRSLNAYLIRNATGQCNKRHTWRGNFSCLSVLLVFTRDKSFYFSTVFVPGMVLVTSSFISFWLDVNAVPARVMIGVTTMLNFCTTTNSFRSALPVVSNLTAMNLWDGVCMFFIYASMLEFIICNYLYRKLPHGSRPVTAAHPTSGALAAPQVSTDRERAHTVEASQRWLKYKSNGRKLAAGADANTHETAVPPTSQTEGTSPPEDRSQLNHRLEADDRVRAAASVFAWLRRPQFFPTELPTKARLAKSIDTVSKTVFPLLFGLFTFSYFLTYAVIKPAQLDEWIETEFEASF